MTPEEEEDMAERREEDKKTLLEMEETEMAPVSQINWLKKSLAMGGYTEGRVRLATGLG